MDVMNHAHGAFLPPLEKGGLGGDQALSDPHPKISQKFSTSPLQGEVTGGLAHKREIQR